MFEPIEVILPPNGTATATVFFFHGCGGTGEEILSIIKSAFGDDFAIPNIKFVFPTAPKIALTSKNGELTRAWFNCINRTFTSPDQEETIHPTCSAIKALIRDEVKAGVPCDRIIIGGFSMGGAIALHAGYRFLTELAGIFVLSSYLHPDSSVYRDLDEEPSTVPLLMCHGDDDTRVPQKWANDTFSKLTSLGVNGKFHLLFNLEHKIEPGELLLLFNWIEKILDIEAY